MEDEKQPTQKTDSANAEGQTKAEAPKADEVLGFLEQSLGRKFSSREDATKSLESLTKMVGDQAIADLRKKAEEGDYFQAVVKSLSEQEGLTLEEAKKALLESTKSDSSTHRMQESNVTQQTATDPKILSELESLKAKFEEQELLKTNPEAERVLAEIRGLAKVQGKSLKEAYEGSSLKGMVTKFAEVEKKEKESASTSVDSKSRQGVDFSAESELVDRVKKVGLYNDKVKLVEKTLGLNG